MADTPGHAGTGGSVDHRGAKPGGASAQRGEPVRRGGRRLERCVLGGGGKKAVQRNKLGKGRVKCRAVPRCGQFGKVRAGGQRQGEEEDKDAHGTP